MRHYKFYYISVRKVLQTLLKTEHSLFDCPITFNPFYIAFFFVILFFITPCAKDYNLLKTFQSFFYPFKPPPGPDYPTEKLEKKLNRCF